MTGAGTAGNPFVANGISIVVSGAPAAGDQFLIKPLDQAPGTLKVLVTTPSDIAAAAPTRTSADLGNTGTGGDIGRQRDRRDESESARDRDDPVHQRHDV